MAMPDPLAAATASPLLSLLIGVVIFVVVIVVIVVIMAILQAVLPRTDSGAAADHAEEGQAEREEAAAGADRGVGAGGPDGG
jgi:heme/copper-type cytochrome/quinol oxidase subunit 2